MSYPNYRISVELIFVNDGKVLLTKRSKHCTVAPGVWNVPAGKVKYEEIPMEAVHREAMEETGLTLKHIEEISVRNQSWKSEQENYYRVIFTYSVEAFNYKVLKLNDEHTDYQWVSMSELSDERFLSLHPELRKIMMEKIFTRNEIATNR